MFLPIFLSTMYETRTALAPNTIRSQIWMLPSKRVCVIYQAFIMHFSKLLNIQTTSITLTVISTMEAADTACRGSWQLVGWRHWKKKKVVLIYVPVRQTRECHHSKSAPSASTWLLFECGSGETAWVMPYKWLTEATLKMQEFVWPDLAGSLRQAGVFVFPHFRDGKEKDEKKEKRQSEVLIGN